MDHASDPDPVTVRLREGFERMALVLRADSWGAAGDAGLNPAQALVLGLLSTRPAGLRVKEIAAHLGVSAPSIADTLGALERKGLLKRTPDPIDARAVIVRLTDDGRDAGRRIASAPSQVCDALTSLSPSEQANLLLMQVKLIRTLQISGAIPVQRMCVTCRHFRPNEHPGQARSHHCAFVNAPIGDRDLRLDCGEHDAAEPAVQTANWAAFQRHDHASTP